MVHLVGLMRGPRQKVRATSTGKGCLTLGSRNTGITVGFLISRDILPSGDFGDIRDGPIPYPSLHRVCF